MSSNQPFSHNINDFIASMISELRTPINTMVGFTEVLLKGIDGPINEQQKSDLTVLSEAGQNAIALLNIMLDVNRIDAGYLEVYCEELNLNQIIDDVISAWPDYRFVLKDFGRFNEFTFRREISAEMPNIWADKLRIPQIIHFLLASFVINTAHSYQDAVLISDYDDRQVVISITTHQPTTTCPDFAEIPRLKVYKNIYENIWDESFGLYEAISRYLIDLHGGELRKIKRGDDFTLSFTLPIDENRPLNGQVTDNQ